MPHGERWLQDADAGNGRRAVLPCELTPMRFVPWPLPWCVARQNTARTTFMGLGSCNRGIRQAGILGVCLPCLSWVAPRALQSVGCDGCPAPRRPYSAMCGAHMMMAHAVQPPPDKRQHTQVAGMHAAQAAGRGRWGRSALPCPA